MKNNEDKNNLWHKPVKFTTRNFGAGGGHSANHTCATPTPDTITPPHATTSKSCQYPCTPPSPMFLGTSLIPNEAYLVFLLILFTGATFHILTTL